MEKRSTVAVVGIWHLGIVSATCLAKYGHKVIGIGTNKENVSNLSKGIPPLFEPGLDELLKECIKANTLSFTSDFRKGVSDADFVVIAFDTPVNDDDTPDLSPIKNSVEKIAPFLKDGSVVVISSQVPVGTCEQIKARIASLRPSLMFGVACIPENLKLGEAISRFKSPDILVIGTDSADSLKKTRQLFGFVEDSKIKAVNFRTAEMVKHAINSFLANQISWANEMGNLCDKLGVDWFDVIAALSLDQRVGRGAFLKSGLAFGGGTLARDVGVLRRIGKEKGSKTRILDAVIDTNLNQNKIVLEKLEGFFGSIKGLKIAALGLTYKPGTSTIRRSAAIDIVKMLLSSGASVTAYDPKAQFTQKEAGVKIDRAKDIASAAKSADAILILTAWPQFKEIDLAKIGKEMSHRVMIDALNIMDPALVKKAGFEYSGIGRGGNIRKL